MAKQLLRAHALASYFLSHRLGNSKNLNWADSVYTFISNRDAKAKRMID
jgi:hypothetical protein